MKRLLLLMACAAAAACSADWRDTSLPPQKRAELLTAEMTLDEKIGQLTSPYGWEMYERHGDSVRLTDAFREAVQNGHIGMLWGTFRACLLYTSRCVEETDGHLRRAIQLQNPAVTK